MTSRYPFSSYPSSWYRIDLARNILIGKLNLYQYFGKSLVCTRDTDGKVILQDGRTLLGNSIHYPIHEANGIVFAYHSDTPQTPDFDIPEIDEFRDPQWSKVRTINYQATSHVQEFVENAVDTGHFVTVHQMPSIPNVEKFELMGRTFAFQSVGNRKVLGFNTSMDIRVRPVGLAVIIGWTLTRMLEVRNVHCVTPINESRVQISVSYVFKKNWNPLRTFILHLILNRALYNFTSPDLPIFAEKKYIQKPMLCGKDGPIARVRHWAQQFY